MIRIEVIGALAATLAIASVGCASANTATAPQGSESPAPEPDAGTAADSASEAEAPACLGDSVEGDAAVAGLCDALPMAKASCSNPGSASSFAPGYHFCLNTANYLRRGVLSGLLSCLAAVPTEQACSEQALDDCTTRTFHAACPSAPAQVDPCATIAASCAAGPSTRGVTSADCHAVLDAFGEPTRSHIAQCYGDLTSAGGGGSGDCAADFFHCYSLPY